MEENDYFVIVYKTLTYLYDILKKGEKVDTEVLTNDGPLYQIHDTYWVYVMDNLQRLGYIAGVYFAGVVTENPVIMSYKDCHITPAGITYMAADTMMNIAAGFIMNRNEQVETSGD